MQSGGFMRILTATALCLTLALPATAQDGDAGAYLAARSAAINQDFRAAADWYTRALISDPGNMRLLEGMVAAQVGTGNFDLAAEPAKRLIDLGAPGQLAPVALTAVQAGNGDFAAIVANRPVLDGVSKLFGQMTVAWAELGQGQMSEALTELDALATTPSLEAFGLYHKALALATVGDFEGADAILSGQANGTITLMRRGVLAHVQILSQLERNPDAIALLDRAFGPDLDPGMTALKARLQAGEPIPYDITRNAADGMAEVFFTIATALNGEADDSYTLIYARAAAALRPDHVDAQLLTAGLLEQLDQYDLAADAYATIPPTDGAHYVAEIGRAAALRDAGKGEAAIEVLQALTRDFPDIVDVHVALGDALRRKEDWAGAVAAYDTGLSLAGDPQPAHWPIWFSRGIAHERLGQWDAFEADMRQALALAPDQPQVLNYLGYSFVDRGENLDEALGMIERAVAAQPESGYIVDSLAWAYFRLGRYQDAVAPMEKASLLEPVDPIVTDHLGDVYWAVGRAREARFQWHRALSFDPTDKDATRIRRKLEVGLDAVLTEEGAPPLSAVTAADGN
jgi:tetratricopeptide (TPR) repeat protein